MARRTTSPMPMDYPSNAVDGILEHRYAGVDQAVQRGTPFHGCTGTSCYGTEGGQGTGATALPRQGAAQAMLAHRYGGG